MTQLRCRFAPESFLIRDSGFTSTGPNFAKSTFGQGSNSMPMPAPVAAGAAALCGARRQPFAERLDVLADDAPVPAAALDVAEIDTELARELAHRRARVRDRKRRLVDATARARRGGLG